ncbi:RHOMBOID-like protein 12, mitochondrial isoform X2 [Impatiens glandulifera]|uniref:RHOMBOID-like protein 12, mitochondrial isoform X2 n=1 Tax=Impatiens glandulifera TaxID=253017 RepID=UPI001FB11FB9|nr:RHOMBOID-like protein 12, mitochondrial isoform X2 [Impatiens glandulifera]
MQNLFASKLASKLPRIVSNSTSYLYPSPLLRTEVNHVLRRYTAAELPAHFSSHFRSSRHPWQSQNILSQKIYGFIPTTALAKRLTTNAIWTKGFISSNVSFLKLQFPKKRLGYHSSFDYQNRSWLSWLRSQTPDRVVLGLILTNTAVFMLWRLADEQFMIQNFTISVNNFNSGRIHTLITSAFSHIDIGHIVSNMLGLYFFGMQIGQTFGADFLLKLYLSGAVVGSIFYLIHHAFIASKGASGAVNAIMLLQIFLFPKSTIFLDFFIPVPAMLLGVFIIGKDLLRVIEGDPQISGATHLGGVAVAAVAWARIRKGRF